MRGTMKNFFITWGGWYITLAMNISAIGIAFFVKNNFILTVLIFLVALAFAFVYKCWIKELMMSIKNNTENA